MPVQMAGGAVGIGLLDPLLDLAAAEFRRIRIARRTGSVAGGDVTPIPGVPTTVATGEPKPARPKAKQAREYRVARGDSLGKIARKFDCDLKDLAQANGLKTPYRVRQGQEIKLQGCKK